jgi:type I restriction enzyme S subunit
MSKDANNVPALRFKGFSDAWEKRKLGDLGQVAMNKRIYKDQTSSTGDVPFYKIGTFGKEADSFISRELFEKYKKMYPFPEAGDILISASGSIGRKLVYDGEDAYFQDSNIIWIKHDERLANSFLNQFLSIVHWNGTEGTTIKRLYNKNVLTTKINIPSRKEQDTIGSCLTIFDNLIAATQGKLDQLEMVKKALLQHLFDQSMRFKGYSDPWEKRKLASLVHFIGTGKSTFTLHPSKDKIFRFPVLGSTSIIGYDSSYDVEGKMILTARVGANAGNLYIYSGKAKITDNTVFLVTDTPSFLKALLDHFDLKKIKFGTGQPLIKASELKRLKLFVPCDPTELDSIQDCVLNINNLIAATQSKLSGLESLKKALLQGLFI